MNKNVLYIGVAALLATTDVYAGGSYGGGGHYPVGCRTSACGTIVRNHVDNHIDVENKNINANANANKNVNANANKNVNANVNKNTANSNAVSKNTNVIKNDVNNASHSSADNHLDVANSQKQGQHQAQDQAQTQSVANSGNSSNQNHVASQGNTTDVNIGGDTYEARRIPVATAIAPNLTAGQITCLGSVSGGIQTGVVGLSGGKTTVDKNCVMITQVNTLYQMGKVKAACERMRQDPDIRAAMEAAGETCEPPVVEPPVAVVTTEVASKQEVQDLNQKLENYIRVDRQNVLK